jgi:hypothetical protein
VFIAGYWHVTKHPKRWRNRTEVERERWQAAYQHTNKLNNSEFYRDMRDMHYKRLDELYKSASQKATEEWLKRPYAAYD